MSERDPHDVPSADRDDESATAPGGTPESRPAPPTADWAVPSPANAAPANAAPVNAAAANAMPVNAAAPGPVAGGLAPDGGPVPPPPPAGAWPTQPYPGSEAMVTAPGGLFTTVPAGSAGSPSPSGVPFLRRKAVLGAAGAGAAVLLVGAGFLAGTQIGGGNDTTRLVSDQSAPMSGGYGAPFGRGQDGDQGVPGGQLPGDGDQDGDGHGPQGGAAAASFVTAGRITAISGTTLTLSTFQGAAAKVTTTSSTTVGGTTGGDITPLTVGQVVFVAGTKTSDGSYQATAIMTRPIGPGGDLSRGDGQNSADGGADSGSGIGSGSGSGRGAGASAGSGSSAQDTT